MGWLVFLCGHYQPRNRFVARRRFACTRLSVESVDLAAADIDWQNPYIYLLCDFGGLELRAFIICLGLRAIFANVSPQWRALALGTRGCLLTDQ